MKLAFDFDRTIHPYSDGWQKGVISEAPPSHVVVGMQMLRDNGHEIIIHSCRTSEDMCDSDDEIQRRLYAIMGWCNVHKIPWDKIWTGRGKPVADMYIGDLAVFCTTARHDWDSLMSRFVLSEQFREQLVDLDGKL